MPLPGIDARKIVLSPDGGASGPPTPTGAAIAAIRLGMRTLSAVSPSAAARLAERLWLTPPRPQIRSEVRAQLETGTRFEIAVAGRSVVGWRWGSGPAVVLAHGWGGFGGQMTGFVEPLTRAGYQAITFDAPAHGASGPSSIGAKQTTLFDFAHAIRGVTDHASQVAGIVAHSGGATALAWMATSQPEWRVPALVFVSPMGSPSKYVGAFRRALGLSDEATQRFLSHMERRFDFRWDDLEVTAMVAGTSPPPPPVLLVHDRDDKETFWEESAAIAEVWPGARLHSTSGLGHRRILRDPDVIETTIQFLRSPVRA